MDKPPEQGAKIIDLFSKRERPPKRLGAMGAKVVELSSIRSSRSDEAPDISPDHIQDAQIIEIPDMPSEIRQEVSELVNDTIKEFKRKESDDPQNYKEIAEKIVELLDKAYRRPDDKPRDNSTKELGVCILTLAVLTLKQSKFSIHQMFSLSLKGLSASLDAQPILTVKPLAWQRLPGNS